MQIVLTRTAEKDLNKISKTDGLKIVEKLETYAANPKALAQQVKKLKGDPILRLRVGNYRILFTEDGVVLTVIRIGHRRDIYR